MNKCGYCEREFVREQTLAVHMCEQKRRHMVKGDRHVQLGFRAYQNFYSNNTNTKNDKTYDEFADSKYYKAFVKFGKYILDINAINPEAFIDFVLRMGVRIDDWSKDSVYNEYICDLMKRESVDRAVERSIILMQEWSAECNEEWTNFFNKVSTNMSVHMIKSGRISPWILYSCSGAQKLLDRMSEEQIQMIADYIEPSYWQKKISTNEKDSAWVEHVFKEAGIS